MRACKQAILGIDEGTSGTRSALIAPDGSSFAAHYEALSVFSTRHNVVEQDANILLEKTLEVCGKTIAAAKDANVDIAAIAIATQRATGVLWDTETGLALVPAMVWQDSRYAEFLKPLAAQWDSRLISQTGRPVGGRAIYLWAARHIQDTPIVRDAFQQRRLAFGTIDSWLLWHLSEDKTVVTTPTNATSAGAYILGQHRYLTDWIEAQDFPPELLPVLKQDADDFGYSRQDVLGIRVPIKASCGDQLGGLIGLGCHNKGQAMCLHGTGSFVDLMLDKDLPQKPGLHEATFTLTAWRRQDQSRFAVETYSTTTGAAINFLCKTMGWFMDAAEINHLAGTVSTANGLSFMPTLTGLRHPNVIPEGRASVIGLSMAHSRAHLAYAVLEGIAHSVVSCAEASADVAGIAIHEVIVGGGLSTSDTLLRLQADLSGTPVCRSAGQDHASLRGAAFLAGCDGLFWNDLTEAQAVLPAGAFFSPQISDGERQDRRARWQALLSEEVARVRSDLYCKQEKKC